MTKIFLVLPVAILACSTQSQMDAAKVLRTSRIDQNYQAVFASLNKGARTCYAIGGTFTVDGQLMPDLGYGIVWVAVTAGLQPSPIIEAKVLKDGNGAKVESKTTAVAGREGYMNWIDYWAKGGTRCPVITVSETPPKI